MQLPCKKTRWPSERWIYKKNYTLIYGGEAKFKGRNGTGFILDKDAR
jgi:hypothetical protein